MGLWELVCVAGCVGNTTINAFFRGFLLSRATFESLWLPAEIECQSPRKSSRSLINPLDQHDWRQKNKFTLQFRDLDDCGGSCGSYLTTFAFHFGTQKPAIVASRNSERSLYKSLCVRKAFSAKLHCRRFAKGRKIWTIFHAFLVIAFLTACLVAILFGEDKTARARSGEISFSRLSSTEQLCKFSGADRWFIFIVFRSFLPFSPASKLFIHSEKLISIERRLLDGKIW